MRPITNRELAEEFAISIHALHYRVRPADDVPSIPIHPFQSTHSITECDSDNGSNWTSWHISIHALHYRVRHATAPDALAKPLAFQSTHSITECDNINDVLITVVPAFQSTHSITECDMTLKSIRERNDYFNPRTPLQSAT